MKTLLVTIIEIENGVSVIAFLKVMIFFNVNHHQGEMFTSHYH